MKAEREDDGTPIVVLYGQRQAVHAIGQPWIAERIAILDDDDPGSPNACLLEAAPDLLAALRGVTADLRLICKARGIAEPKTLDAADAAIAASQ